MPSMNHYPNPQHQYAYPTFGGYQTAPAAPHHHQQHGQPVYAYPNGAGVGGGAMMMGPREEHYASMAGPQAHMQPPYVPPADYMMPPSMVYQQHPPDAVECRGLMKCYGHGKGKTKALSNVNMNVEQGSIYGLLGPSGCGKTTLLSCIVGRLRTDAGSIRVFGQKPGHKDSGVPGSLVGYMPQEVALYQQFSIEETLRYFGRIHGMPMEDIKHRTQFLIRFLGLPNSGRMVENLSGGQQRRVSLACALLQKPKLLILDEPTVGVDPLLRYSIWCHLVNLARDEGTSVVITTHYIEEARQANRVGLMRNGGLLAQASPESLLIAHRLPTLEDVFLKLCQSVEGLQKTRPGSGQEQPVGFIAAQRAKQMAYSNAHVRRGGSQASDSWALMPAQSRRSGSSSSSREGGLLSPAYQNAHYSSNPSSKRSSAAYDNPVFTLSGDADGGTRDGRRRSSRMRENLVNGSAGGLMATKLGKENEGIFQGGGGDPYPVTTKTRRGRNWIPTLSTMRALLIKNFISMFRHIGALTFEIILPPFQIVLFCLTLNSDPKNLVLSIFNQEAVNVTSPTEAVCDLVQFSCDLVDAFSSEVIKPRYYTSIEDANAAVLNGEAWGSIHIRPNFSSSLIDRALHGIDITNDTIHQSTIDVRLDMTNQQVGFIITRELLLSFHSFFKKTMGDYGYNPELASLPIGFGEPIYGVKEPQYTEFVAPGMLVMIVFFMALGLTAMAFVLERKQGLIYRSYVAGVKNVEVLICYMITEVFVMIIQIALTLIVLLVVFEIPNRGSIWVISLLCFVQGVCGMSFGLLVSSIFNDETSTIVACLGVFLPCLLLSGMCWPREAMLPILGYVSSILPQTYGTDALRNVMSRGNGLNNFTVGMGCIVPIIWTVIQLAFSAVCIHLKEGF